MLQYCNFSTIRFSIFRRRPRQPRGTKSSLRAPRCPHEVRQELPSVGRQELHLLFVFGFILLRVEDWLQQLQNETVRELCRFLRLLVDFAFILLLCLISFSDLLTNISHNIVQECGVGSAVDSILRVHVSVVEYISRLTCQHQCKAL